MVIKQVLINGLLPGENSSMGATLIAQALGRDIKPDQIPPQVDTGGANTKESLSTEISPAEGMGATPSLSFVVQANTENEEKSDGGMRGLVF